MSDGCLPIEHRQQRTSDTPRRVEIPGDVLRSPRAVDDRHRAHPGHTRGNRPRSEERDRESLGDQAEHDSGRVDFECDVAIDARRPEGDVALGSPRRPGREVHEDVLGEIAKSQSGARRESVGTREHRDVMIDGDLPVSDTAGLGARLQPEKRDIQIAAPDLRDELIAVAHLQFDPYGGVCGSERREEARNADGDDRRDDSDPNGAVQLIGLGGHRIDGLLRRSERAARRWEEGLPRFGHPDTAARPDEQSLTQLPLEGGDLVAQRGLRDEATLGGSGEAPRRGHLDDVAHLLKLHLNMISRHEQHAQNALDSCWLRVHAENMNRLRILLLTALAPMAWGTTYLVTTEMLPPGHPLFAGLLRSLPAGVLAILLSRRLPRGAWWGKAVVLGALNIGAFFPLLFLAAERLPGGVAAAVAGAQPLIVLALGALVLHERIRPSSAAAALGGTMGVALIVLGPSAGLDAWGVLAALGGVTATGAGMVLTKRWGRPKGVGPITYAGWQLGAGGLVLLPLTLLIEGTPPAIDATAALGYTWLATAGGIFAYTLWFGGIQKLPVIAPGLLALLSPVVATLLGVVVAGESFTVIQGVGIAVVLAALVGGQFAAMPGRAVSSCRTASGSRRDRPRSARSRRRPDRIPNRSAAR